jgi:hypothetical protein
MSIFEAPVEGETRDKLFIVLIMHYDDFKDVLKFLSESLEIRARRYHISPADLVLASQALKSRFRLLNLDSTSSTDVGSLPQTIVQELEMMRESWRRSETYVGDIKNDIATLTASFADLEARVEAANGRREKRLIEYLAGQFESIRRPCHELSVMVWERFSGVLTPTFEAITRMSEPLWGGGAGESDGGQGVGSTAGEDERMVGIEDVTRYPETKVSLSKVTLKQGLRDIMILKMHKLEMPESWDKETRKQGVATRGVYSRMVELLGEKDLRFKRWIAESLPATSGNDKLQRERADQMSGIYQPAFISRFHSEVQEITGKEDQ